MVLAKHGLLWRVQITSPGRWLKSRSGRFVEKRFLQLLDYDLCTENGTFILELLLSLPWKMMRYLHSTVQNPS